MKAACLHNLTFDPKEIAELAVADNKIIPGRVTYSLNEGDIRAIVALKKLECEIHAISFGRLDATTLVHAFVRGATEVYQVGDVMGHDIPEKSICTAISRQIERIGDVQMFACGGVEQDSGRSLIAAGVAASLGWEFVSNVLEIEVRDGVAHIKQALDEGVQLIEVKLPVCITLDETCDLGGDPSDEFDLIESLEDRESITVSLDGLTTGVEEKATLVELSEPAENEAQEKVSLDNSSIGRVIDLITRYAN